MRWHRGCLCGCGMMMESSKNSPKKRILVVEDELELRKLIKSVLCLDSHEVVEANNGAEAISMFAQSHFDLVMTDHKMPFITGSELAARIRQMSPSKPILMVTGHDNPASPRNPVDAVMQKPFAVESLRAIVANLLAATEKAAA
jgi:CheY-like chemotaxis protein